MEVACCEAACWFDTGDLKHFLRIISPNKRSDGLGISKKHTNKGQKRAIKKRGRTVRRFYKELRWEPKQGEGPKWVSEWTNKIIMGALINDHTRRSDQFWGCSRLLISLLHHFGYPSGSSAGTGRSFELRGQLRRRGLRRRIGSDIGQQHGHVQFLSAVQFNLKKTSKIQ